MKLLLCGANGRIGREIIFAHDIFEFELITTNSSQLDITNPTSISTNITEIKPDIIINAAAYTDVDQAEINPALAFKINKDGCRYLANICKKYNILLIHLSTDYVFSGNKNALYTEEDMPDPTNVYGKSKLAGELEIINTWNKHIILRTSWVFGAYGNNFVKTILKKSIETPSQLTVSNEIGCPTSAASLAACILTIAKQIHAGNNASWGIYHYCGIPFINRYQYTINILEIAKNYFPLQTTKIKPMAHDLSIQKTRRPCYSAMQTNKICKTFNILPDNWHDSLIKLMPTLLNSGEFIQ